MAQADVLFHALNQGVVDDDNLQRIDLAKMRLSMEEQTNIIPLATGRAFLRPGTEFVAEAEDSSLEPFLIQFDAGQGAGYVLELHNEVMRILDGDTDALIERDAVSTAVTTGDFSSATGWTLASTSGQTSQVSGGELILSARARGATASAKQTLTISAGDSNTIHALRIVVSRGPILFRLGTTNDGEELIRETSLDTGEHSLAFDPGGATSVFLKFFTQTQYTVRVTSCEIEAAGIVELPTPWGEADLPYIHVDQSLDVMYAVAGEAGISPYKIERRGQDDAAGLSWSVAEYHADDGPFFPGRTARIELEPDFTEGDVEITSSAPFFVDGMVGTLFKLWHNGQRIDTYLAAENQYTPTFLMTGITETNFEEREYAYTISGTWSGTLRNFRSFDGEDTGFHQYRREQASAVIDITGNGSFTNDDNDDNALVWVRLGFDDGTYTSGEAHIISIYNGGGGYGICRITDVTSPTTANARVLRPFYGVTMTAEWQEGQWSERGGYPAGVALSGGRLDFGGQDFFWGSISDSYNSFDEEFEGDAAPISRSIALKGRNVVRWMLGTDALLIGCNTRVVQARASTLEEALTASNVNMVNVDKIPCSEVAPVELKNSRSLFVAGNRSSIYELSYSTQAAGYLATKFSLITDKVFLPGVRQMAVSSFPEQRVWCVLDDGSAVCVLYEPLLDVVAVIPIALRDGDTFEGVCVLPGLVQDRVYFATRRFINGQWKRYLEKLALDSEAKPISISKCMDAHAVFGAGSATITGLSHLEGETVVVWMDGAPVNDDDGVTREFSVAGGQITLPSVPTIGGCVGLPYVGRLKTARLAYGQEGTSPFFRMKTLDRVGFLLAYYVRSGIKFGWVFDNDDHPLTSLPELKNGTTAVDVVTGVDSDEHMNPIASSPNTQDPRLCMEISAPKCCTILSVVLGVGV